MDLRFTAEETAFREEVRDFFRTALPSASATSSSWAITPRRTSSSTGSASSTPRAGRCRTGRSSGAARTGRRCSATSGSEEMQQRRRPQPLPFNVTMVGPVIVAFGTRGAEGALPAAHRQPRRSGGARASPSPAPAPTSPRCKTTRGARRRRLRRQRPEDLDHARPVRRLDLLPGAHRPGGEEAGGHLVPADRHEDARASPCGRSSTIDGGHEVNEVFFDDVRCRPRTSSARRTRAGTTPSSCSATSASASPASASRSERVRRIKELAAHRARRRRAADRGRRASARSSPRSRSS